MGRAGGGSRGGGGSRSFGGRSGGSRSFGGGGRSFSSGSRSFSGGTGRSSFSGSSFGGNHVPRPHHRPPIRPIYINPGYGRKTVIINNSGNTTNTGTNNGPNTYTNTSNTNNTATQQTYTAPKPLTPEQKVTRAERLAQEAREAKKGTIKLFLIALVLLVLGAVASRPSANEEKFEKISLTGTNNVGYATDEINGVSGVKLTEDACEEFYETVGVPIYFYTEEYYEGSDEVAYAAELYDALFQDENHMLMVYCDNLDIWSWCVGGHVPNIVNPDALLDEIEAYWYDYSLSFDEVLAKGVSAYQRSLTASDSENTGVFSGLLFIAGGIVLIIAVYTFINKGKEAERYEEEAKTLQAEILLSKPLETFGNQEINDLKDKYDNL